MTPDKLPYKRRRRRPISERFWTKVTKTEGCWLWAASLTSTGYGQIYSGGHPSEGRPLKAHRVSWELTYGPIPAGKEVCHRCDVPRCVRPEHLFLGTHAENMADVSAKGRGGNRKLTAAQAREIVRLRAAGSGIRPLARQFGVNRGVVLRILAGQHYRDAA